ncbi:hypothetical protein RFI_18914 [Reticulomyxa filosa]|uniref:CSD domain-containing protein n=1 Tax=Reticulomyxa filosa TaxID=46433 RepID=X6MY23_RETFI|nr:hypothetical protein RFI_18914 [Reticulomyxa filosa]|eukprot:ETO18362.1 hypothetical protein RFI_18914 [Reticulomyxa filosa]
MLRFTTRLYGNVTGAKRSFAVLARKKNKEEKVEGYIAYFNLENMCGFAVKDDEPENTYQFNALEIYSINVPRVRIFQQVSFSAQKYKENKLLARNIAARNGDPIDFSHKNYMIPKEKRRKHLSMLSKSSLTTRFKGMIYCIVQTLNLTRLNSKFCMFVFSLIRYLLKTTKRQNTNTKTTGREHVRPWSEVEFYVKKLKPTKKKPIVEEAIAITRPGGGLITWEIKQIGTLRRVLGNVYGTNDRSTHLTMTQHNQFQRKEGYVSRYNHDDLYGFIIPFNDPTQEVFVHIDNCHIFGKRALRRFTHVEFEIANPNEVNLQGRLQAIHVSGPQQTVLRYNSDNHYLPLSLCTDRDMLSVSQFTRYVGEVYKPFRPAEWFFIKPNNYGAAPVLAYYQDIQVLPMFAMNRQDVLPGDFVEFSVLRDEKVGTMTRVFNVSGGGGKPVVAEGLLYGSYLRSRIHLFDSALPDCPFTLPGEPIDGWIANFDPVTQTGRIEVRLCILQCLHTHTHAILLFLTKHHHLVIVITKKKKVEAPKNQRYNQIGFALADAMQPKDTNDPNDSSAKDESDFQNKVPPIGCPVTFEVRKSTHSFPPHRTMNNTQEAFNITSKGLSFLKINKTQNKNSLKTNQATTA